MLPPTFFACCCVYCGCLSASPALFHLLPWQFSILIFESFLKYTTHRSQLREMRAEFGEIVLRSQDLPQIRLLRVGVLISKLHPCTRRRKSSFTERSFIVAWLSVQFPEVPEIRVNILISPPRLVCPLFRWLVPLVPSIVLKILTPRLICGCRGQSSEMNSVSSIWEDLELEQGLPEKRWSIIILLFIWLSTMSFKLTYECIFDQINHNDSLLEFYISTMATAGTVSVPP